MLKYHHKDQIRGTLQMSSESAKGHNKTHNPIPNRRNLLYCAGPKHGVGIAVVIVLETLYFLFSLYIYRTLSALVILNLPQLFHCRTGKYVVIVRFYITHTRLLLSICEIYAPLCKITHIHELYFLYSFNKFILFFFFSSIDRLVTIFII